MEGELLPVDRGADVMDLNSLRQRRDIVQVIDWDLTPQEAVEMFDHRARGLEKRLRVRSSKEQYYFFCVDNWGSSPRLVLKKRSIKEAKVIAEIEAPEELLTACVRAHGNRKGLFPLTDELKGWLRDHIYR